MIKESTRSRVAMGVVGLAILLSCTGCLTDKTLTAAHEYRPPKEISTGPNAEPKEAKPAYYALLPFAVVGDIALMPVYIIWFAVDYAITGRID